MTEQGPADPMEVWRSLAETALKGAPLSSLDTVTPDGVRLKPLHGPARPIYAGRAAPGAWSAIQRVDDDANANHQALDDLANGAHGLTLVFAGAPSAFGRGLVADTLPALAEVLDGVHLDHCLLRLEGGSRGVEALAMATALAEHRRTVPLSVHAGIDPFGAFVTGGAMAPLAEQAPRLADAVTATRGRSGITTLFRADGRPLAEAGATPAQELAFAVASATALARLLDTQGVGPAEALPRIEMALSADQDQFATIAKLRAARRLWRLVSDACGVVAPLTLHVSTKRRMLSWSDPHTNLVRLTVAALAAGVGGADSVTVLPFDAEHGAFARRLSRNIQTLLLEESHVAALADPGAGAGAVETYTDAIASRAWALVTAYETTDLASAIARGDVAADVKRAADAEAAAIANGERSIIGVTRHPPAEPASPPSETRRPAPLNRNLTVNGDTFRDLVAAALNGATLADLAAAGPQKTLTAPTLAPERAAEPFEG